MVEAVTVGVPSWNDVGGTVAPAFVNVKDFGALGNGSGNDTASIQAAINSIPNGGDVLIPRGTYPITQPLLITNSGVNLVGEGSRATILQFQPTVNASCIRVQASTNIAIGFNRIQGMTLDAAGDTTHSKTGIQFVDVEEFEISDVQISNWTDPAKTSIGIEAEGRQSVQIERITISAPNPIVIAKNPNLAAGGIDCDHFHLEDCYLLADSNPNITIQNGVNLTNFTVDGYQAWVLGTYGLYFNSPASTIASYAIHIGNVRWEQGTGTAGYAIYWAPLNSFALNIVGCYMGAVNGFFLRNVASGSMIGCDYATPSPLVALNIDSTVAMNFIGNFFNSGGGATLSTAGFVNGLWLANDSSSKAGIGVAAPVNQMVLPNNQWLAAKNTSGTEVQIAKVDTINAIQIAPNSTVYMGQSLFVGATDVPFSGSGMMVAHTSRFAGQNAAGTDVISIAQIDASNNVLISGGGAPIRLGVTAVGSGGGAVPTLAINVGATGGPTTAAQNGWIQLSDFNGNPFWLPIWR